MMRWLHYRNSFIHFICLPLLIITIYLFFLASDLYQTNSQFIIKQNTTENGSTIFDLGFFTNTISTSHEDALLLKEFIHSQDLLQILDKEVGLMDHYSSPRLDFVRRLSRSATKKDFLEYYRKMVSVNIIPDSNIVSLSILSFDPAVTLKVIDLILSHSESFINRISKRLADEQVKFVQQEVDRTEHSLRKVKENLLRFQNRRTLVNPESDIKSKVDIIAEMQADIIQKKATLKELRGFLREDVFQITSLQNQITALESQVQEEMKQLAGSAKVSLNQVMVEFQNLSTDVEFAENAYKSAYASLQTAQVDAARKLKHMVVISSYGEPDEPAYPRRFYSLSTSFVVLLLIYGIGKLVISTINDHRE